MSELSELGEAALWYVKNGFAVFPVVERGKRPAVRRGVNDWTTNPDDVVIHWKEHPNDNIGIACGSPSKGLLVLDFDVDEESEKDGTATLSAWERANGELPETAIAITGGGGMHYLYRTGRTNIHPSVNQELGVDVRADGSYIVAPPSVHPSGRRYEWQDPPDETPVAEADDNVYDFLDYVTRNGGTDETKKDNGKFKLPDKIKRGTRDNVLFKYASHLRSIGRSDEEIMASVAGVNALRCEPPMDSRDIERIVRSACRYERGEDESSDREVGRPGKPSTFRGKRGGLLTNELGKEIIARNHARIIDGAPAVWTGKRWEFGTRAINRCVLDLADDAKKQDKSEVVSYVMDKAPCVTSDASFDGRYYVQFADVTYDVMAEEVVEPKPSMYVIATLPVELNLDEPYNDADRFLASLANGDESVKQALCEVIGACMCSRRAIAQSPMLIGRAGGSAGKASNGKSTYLNWLRSILGPQNTSSLDIATLGQRFQAGRVVGKLANLGDDIPDGFLRGEELSTFKKLVTGDSIFTDVKNGEGFEFRPSATMVFSMNSIPRLSDTTDGIFRRLYFLPFRRRFSPSDSDFDPNMALKLARPEVMRRGAVLGLMSLRGLIRRGALTHIPDMAEEVEEVRQDNDSVARWLFEDDLSVDYFRKVRVSDAYRRYFDWCRESGERNPCSMRTFSTRVKESSLFRGVTVVTQSIRFSDKTARAFVVLDEEMSLN